MKLPERRGRGAGGVRGGESNFQVTVGFKP